MAATWSICPAANVSLASSMGRISGNFTLIQNAIGIGTLSAGVSWVQGDIPYTASATQLQRLAKSADATRYLSNQGSSNNPSWGLVSLTNGVTGILPTTNGGTGSNVTTASYCNLGVNVVGTLPIVRGGTGSATASYCSLASNVYGTLPAARMTSDVTIKGWVNTNQGSIRDSYNVTSVTDNGTGNYVVNWATDFANANYSVVGSLRTTEGTVVMLMLTALAAGTTEVHTGDLADNQGDVDTVCVIAIGDQ